MLHPVNARRVRARSRLVLPFAGLAILSSCAELSTVPERIPTELRIEDQVVTTSEGSSVLPEVVVLDQNGVPMEDVPAWARPRWSVSDRSVLEVADTRLEAVGPGASTATGSTAGLETSFTVRVNPAQLRLQIADVEFHQTNNSGSHLDSGRETELRVYVVGDKVNFFRPVVRATLYRNGAAIATYDMQRAKESVPLASEVLSADDAWTVSVPGVHIQPGVEVVVEADPSGSIPRADGSADRFPNAGQFALDVRAVQLQLRVQGAYLNQSVQRMDGSLPLVAGRDALLRVFVTGDEPTDLTTSVRGTFYRAGVAVRTVTLDRESAIPTGVSQVSLGDSWNYSVPGDWIESGLSIVLEADPEGAIGLKEGSEPRYPSAGTLALDVRDVPPFRIRMVPITQSGTGATGTITGELLPSYLRAVESRFPLREIDLDLRTPYTTTSVASTADGWLAILREIDAVRVADASGRYYYGVLRRPGGVAISGIGYVGWPAAVGWDAMPWATETFAHEIGHNFSLYHAPCGSPSGPDPLYPYANGGIGVHGYDITTGQVKLPSAQKDLMTYCDPAWISDFHYSKALDYRHRWDWPSGTATEEGALLVWGGVEAGRLVLEPAFELEMRPELPPAGDRYTITGFDAAGGEIFSYGFDPAPVDHMDGSMSFAFAIPARFAEPDRLIRLTLTGPEGEVTRVRTEATVADGRAAIGTAGGSFSLSDGGDFEMALVRDRATGEILSFARAGAFMIFDRPVEVLLSDGVRTVRP